MTQNQTLGVAVGVAVMLFASVFVYQQFAGREDATMQYGNAPKESMTALETEQAIPVPATIDDVMVSIEAESALDLSALDEEESAALSEVEADSASVTNLGTSYDENSY